MSESVPAGAGRGGRVTLPELRHEEHELAWAAVGAAQIEIGDRCWRVTTTTGIWIPAGVAHRVTIEADSLVTPAYFSTAALWAEATAVTLSPELRSALQHRVQCQWSGLPLEPAATDHTLALVATHGPAERSLPMPRSAEALRVAQTLLDDPADQRTLDSWSRELYVGAKSLQRSFTVETGHRFTDWRTQARLRAALPLLARGHQVSAVSRAVGYTSPGGFITAFRRQFGSSPGAHFRQRERSALV